MRLKVNMSGWLELEHHFETVLGFTPSSLANQILVFLRSASITFILLVGFLSIYEIFYKDNENFSIKWNPCKDYRLSLTSSIYEPRQGRRFSVRSYCGREERQVPLRFPLVSTPVSLHKFPRASKIWVSRSCHLLHTCLFIPSMSAVLACTKNGQPCRICSKEHNKRGNN